MRGSERSRHSAWLIVCGLALLLAPVGLVAQVLETITQRLETPLIGDGASGDNFGIALALDQDLAVVGAYGDVVVAPGAPTGVAQGSAYAFMRQPDGSWLRIQKITPGTIGEDGDNFGLALALSGGTLAVGAPRRNAGNQAEAGAVFLFAVGSAGLVEKQLVTAPVPELDVRFGTAVAMSGPWLAVGVPQSGAGRVDIFRRQANGTYAFEHSLFPAGGLTNADFGAAVAISGDELLIGAPNTGGSGDVFRSHYDGASWSVATRLNLAAPAAAQLGVSLAIDGAAALAGAPGAAAGAVHRLSFDGSQWSLLAVLEPPDGLTGDRFGAAVALDQDRVVVSALGALEAEGAVYVYPRSGQLLGPPQKLGTIDGGNANRFGAAVAVNANGVLVGADLAQVGPNTLQGSATWYASAPTGVVQAAVLDSGDGALLDRYGSAVAVDGDVAMVGAYLEDTAAGGDAGRVHWFERVAGQWVRRGAIDAPDAQIEDRFGIAISIDGDRAVIGAYWDVVGNHVDQGSVYVFQRQGNSWVLDAKINAADGRERDYFGFAVALQGDRLLVGARGAAVPFVDQGTAYVFERVAGSWSQTARLDLPKGQVQSYFGASVALAGDRALIGAPGVAMPPNVSGAGAAYVFVRQGANWVLDGELRAPLPQSNAAFGFSVDADAQRLLVGAFQDGAVAQGAAYVYRASTRALEASLQAAAPQPLEGMGISVALAGDSILLGASGFDVGASQSAGAAHLFERNPSGWTETRFLLAYDAVASDSFGRAVAADGGHLIIGAPGKSGDNPQEGMAYAGYAERLFADGYE